MAYLIDVKHDKKLDMDDIRDYIEELGFKKPSESTIRRWCNKGLRGNFLHSVVVGGTYYSTEHAIDVFFQQAVKPKQFKE